MGEADQQELLAMLEDGARHSAVYTNTGDPPRYGTQEELDFIRGNLRKKASKQFWMDLISGLTPPTPLERDFLEQARLRRRSDVDPAWGGAEAQLVGLSRWQGLTVMTRCSWWLNYGRVWVATETGEPQTYAQVEEQAGRLVVTRLVGDKGNSPVRFTPMEGYRWLQQLGVGQNWEVSVCSK